MDKNFFFFLLLFLNIFVRKLFLVYSEYYYVDFFLKEWKNGKQAKKMEWRTAGRSLSGPTKWAPKSPYHCPLHQFGGPLAHTHDTPISLWEKWESSSPQFLIITITIISFNSLNNQVKEEPFSSSSSRKSQSQKAMAVRFDFFYSFSMCVCLIWDSLFVCGAFRLGFGLLVA